MSYFDEGRLLMYQNNFTKPEITTRIRNLEQSQEMQKKLVSVKSKMKNNIPNLIDLRLVLGILLALLVLNTRYYYFLPIVLVLYTNLFAPRNKEEVDISEDYAENFLRPILEEVFPETKLLYNEGLALDVFELILPGSDKYNSNCHIIFADSYKTEFSNMTALFVTRDNKGKTIHKVDFTGQVFQINLSTNVKGHIRIIPSTEKSLLGSKNYRAYGKIRENEREITTESIKFNEDYSIFATDDFNTRLILDPTIINILNTWREKMKVCLYMDENQLIIAFDSGGFLFLLPRLKSDVDSLSIAGEYEKVRVKLADFYELVERIREKL